MQVVKKEWGEEFWIENNLDYCMKLLKLDKGKRCSLHLHPRKHETFLVIEGEVFMELEDQSRLLKPWVYVIVPPNTKHRFSGLEDSKIIEASTHHSDDDVVRFEKSGDMPSWAHE